MVHQGSFPLEFGILRGAERRDSFSDTTYYCSGVIGSIPLMDTLWGGGREGGSVRVRGVVLVR